jgi:hypothetical protein
MSKHGTWTVVFEDKKIIKKTEEYSITNPMPHEINDDAFWNQPKFSNLHAIQFTDDNLDNDQVEFKDNSPNGEYDQDNLGDFRQNFIVRWDAAHLAHLQKEWDENVIDIEDPEGSKVFRNETEEEKIARLGARPTTYTSA